MKESENKPRLNRVPLECRVVRPGAGWRHLAGSVYEHTNGTRMHMLGTIRTPSGKYISASEWPESKNADRFILINGGNRKRGLMAWSLTHNV